MKIFFHNFYIFIFILFANTSFADNEQNNNKRKSYNSLGQVGLIHLPSAEIKDEQSIYFTYKKSDYDKLGSLTVSPFKWLEATYFYYRPSDLYWGGVGSNLGKYLDKGFNVKLSYKPKNQFLPRIAVGLDDFAGTGQFTKEYIVTTYDFNSFKISTGIGFGKFVGNNGHILDNPFKSINNAFSVRGSSSSNFKFGGSPSYDLWFRGKGVLFSGIEFFIPKTNGLSLKIESDPYDYFKFSCCGDGRSPLSDVARKKDSNINIGLSYPLKRFGNLDLSFIKGNTINLSLSIGMSFNRNLQKKDRFQPKIIDTDYSQTKKNEFYLDLLNNLNSNKLYLQTATLERDKLSISIDSEEFINPIRYSSRAAFIAKRILEINDYSVSRIDVGNIVKGTEINNISYKYDDLEIDYRSISLVKRNTKIHNESLTSFHDDEFRPVVEFPAFGYSLSPDFRAHIGSPARFIYSGIGIKVESDLQMSRNLVLSLSIAKSIEDNFDKKVAVDSSNLPGVPRTEVVKYLQASSKDFYIPHFQIDDIRSPLKNIYTRTSIGILEGMYGGISAEVLYRPHNSNFAFSYEFNNVKKRAYDMQLDFLEYEVKTKHLNIAYYEPFTNILLKWSYGHYLAKDKGYTLDLSRRMPSGWTSGVFFSRTNVPFAVFGEGSFDKGFYFNIPLNIFSKNYNRQSQGFRLRTMTRDGGQKLEIRNRLIDSFYGSSLSEIEESWDGFLN